MSTATLTKADDQQQRGTGLRDALERVRYQRGTIGQHLNAIDAERKALEAEEESLVVIEADLIAAIEAADRH